MKTEVNVNPNGVPLTILEGKALEPKAPLSIKLSGVLEAPFQFLSGKKRFVPEDCYITIQKDKGQICLVLDETDPHRISTILGSLTKDTNLQEFAINSEKRWHISEFLKFIKTMRYFFADKAAHATLVSSIQKWSVNIERTINEHNDNKGNSNFQLETKVRAVEGFVSKFDLFIPIFQGYSKMKFTVEIGLDPKNTLVQLYLFSDELFELEIGQRESLIETEIGKFVDFDCSKVVLS